MGYVKIAILAIIVLLVAKFIIKLGLKEIIGMAINAALGVLILYLVNVTGILSIPINWLTIIVTGLLGLPGVILIILYTICFQL